MACQCLWLLSRRVYRVTVLSPFWKSLKWLQALCFLLLWGSLSHLSLTNGFGGTCCAMKKKKHNIMDSMPEISRHKHSAGFQTRLTTDCVNYVLWNIGKAAVWRLSHMQFITITRANVRETLELIVLDKHVNEIIVPWLQCKVRPSTYIYSYIWSNILLVMLLYFWSRLKVKYVISLPWNYYLNRYCSNSIMWARWMPERCCAFVPVSLQWVLKARGQGLAG